ncbi:hypothetical protein [Acuticoccus sp.]|uniref:hypothetical protein n=1 Tax=Acuticoccus sp. TaxID=1904378 RepID=UPI003B516B43
MKLFLKLMILVTILVAMSPLLAPGSQLAGVVGAAVEDARAFCERRPQACHQGADLARQTGDAIAAALSSLHNATQAPGIVNSPSNSTEPSPFTTDPMTEERADDLTDVDRALAPASAQERKAAFAGHGLAD